MRIFVYGLSSSHAQCPSYNTNKETVLYKPSYIVLHVHLYDGKICDLFFSRYFLAERQLLHWAVRNGDIRISQALLKFVSYVDAPNFPGGTPLHFVFARMPVSSIKQMICTCLPMLLLFILIEIWHRTRQWEHSVKSTSTFCTKTTSSSSDATGCDRNGSQNGQSCLPVRSYCKRETDECYDVTSPTTCSPVRNDCEEDIRDCYDVKSDESKTSAKPSSSNCITLINTKATT